MLGRLIKYEFKATARTFLPLYGVLLLLAGLNRLFMEFKFQNFAFGIPQILSWILYGCIIVAIFVISLLVMIQRFYRNLLKEEGYLMFTLPVPPRNHIFAKLFTSMVWMLGSIVVTLVSVGILALGSGMFTSLFRGLVEMQQNFDGDVALFWLTMLNFFVMVLSALASSILMIYCAISLGQLFNQHRVAAAFGCYVGIYMVMQAFNTTLMLILGTIFTNNTESILRYFDTPYAMVGGVNIMIGGLGLLEIAYAVGFFLLTNFIFKRQLNLE